MLERSSADFAMPNLDRRKRLAYIDNLPWAPTWDALHTVKMHRVNAMELQHVDQSFLTIINSAKRNADKITYILVTGLSGSAKGTLAGQMGANLYRDPVLQKWSRQTGKDIDIRFLSFSMNAIECRALGIIAPDQTNGKYTHESYRLMADHMAQVIDEDRQISFAKNLRIRIIETSTPTIENDRGLGVITKLANDPSVNTFLFGTLRNEEITRHMLKLRAEMEAEKPNWTILEEENIAITWSRGLRERLYVIPANFINQKFRKMVLGVMKETQNTTQGVSRNDKELMEECRQLKVNTLYDYYTYLSQKLKLPMGKKMWTVMPLYNAKAMKIVDLDYLFQNMAYLRNPKILGNFYREMLKMLASL